MSRRKDHELIWLRPEPNDRRPRLNREQITAAVLGIADREGFEAVTMKRIASELDCGTMTLYYYVRTKADIVALMHDAILAEILIPDDRLPADWREAVAAIARRTREVLLAHPWSLASLNDAQFGPNAMRHMEQSFAALDALDLKPSEKLSFWGIVDDYVFGSALHTIESLMHAAAAKSNPTLFADAMKFGREQLATGQFPRLAALNPPQPAPKRSASDKSGSSPTSAALAAQFECGLKALLDGLTSGMNLA
jgi:AcrR family transcriptional regulator